MRPYTPKVNKHVVYISSAGKPRPGTITAVIDATHVNLRVGRSGETYANVARRVNANDVNVWTPA